MLRITAAVLGLMIIAAGFLALPAAADWDWMTRTGTIGHALLLKDGEHVYLDAVEVDKIKAPAYFVVRECFDARARLIVCAAPASELRRNQTVDVEGDLITLSSGQRGLANARTLAYTDERGTILYHGPLIKGLLEPTPWLWKSILGSPASEDSSRLTSSVDEFSEPLDSEEDDNPTYYETIGDVLYLPNGSLVELNCKSVVSTGSDPTYGSYFVMGEDYSSDTIRVYRAGSANQTDRVNRVSGQIRTQGTSRVLCVDSGPGYDPQLYVGSAQMAASGTVAWAKTFADYSGLPTDGRSHALEGKRVAWVNGSTGQVYVEEPDRSAGILVCAGTIPPDEPCSVSIDGEVDPNEEGERAIYGELTVTPGGSTVRPLGLANAGLGGGDFNAYTPGPTPASPGLHNVGLLVRTWGRVTSTAPDYYYFYINDGSNRSDETYDLITSEPNVGVRILYTDTPFPSVGDYVVVTGACGIATDWGTFTRVVCVKTTGLLDVKMYPPRVAPDGLSATGCNGKVALSWNPLNADNYGVYRSTSQSGTYTNIGTPTWPEYTDNAVTNGTTYWYKLV